MGNMMMMTMTTTTVYLDQYRGCFLYSHKHSAWPLRVPSVTSWAARRLSKYYRSFPVRVAESGKQQNYDDFDFKNYYLHRSVK
jgi:hypothetical protein